jgi:stage III sporulation protein AE
MIVAIDFVSRFNLYFCLPLLEIYTVICLIGSISPQVRMSGIAGFIKKATTFFMGLMLTIFVGALSLQGVLASSADSAAFKVMKFTAGSFVPVVGSILGEALNTVLGAAALLRTTVGIFGIGVFIYIALPVIISVLLRMIVLSLASLVAYMLGQDNAGAFLKDLSGALSITFAILATVSALFIMSVAVTATMGGIK